MTKTKICVAVFLLVLLVAASSAWAENGPKIGLGHTGINSHMTVGEIAYEYNNWEAAASIIGQGDTQGGKQDAVNVYSVSKLVRPDWCFLGGCNYYRLGVASVDGSPLVGPFNYRLGVGMEWKLLSVEFFHYSSAGIYDPNTGIDGLMLKLNIPIK